MNATDPIVVITELHLLPPEQRWETLIAPLHQALDDSGLGHLPDYDTLHREHTLSGRATATEIAVALRRLDYGRDLLDEVLATAGLSPEIRYPDRWRPYHCDEYFTAHWAAKGHFDDFSQTPVVHPYREIYEDPAAHFLVIGASGGDGIHFGYRAGETSLWAYPVDGEFKGMAASLAALVEGWCSGKLSL